MHKPEIEDLQSEIHQLKKLQLEVKSENHLLKVKIRKLQNEVNKKNKQVDSLLDPKKAIHVRKLINQHGATLICGLREENFLLRKQLGEQDYLIRRLNSDLQTAKLYVAEKSRIVSPSMKFIETEDILHNLCDFTENSSVRSDHKIKEHFTKIRSRSVSSSFKRSSSSSPTRKESKSATNLQSSYIAMLNNNLQKIRESGKEQSLYATVPDSHKQIPPHQNDTPNEEIQQLHTYFLNIINEVSALKNTLKQLQKEQTQTSIVLKDKNMNIEKLASELESLKMNQSKSIEGSKGDSQKPQNACLLASASKDTEESLDPINIHTEILSNFKSYLNLEFNKYKSSSKTIGIQTARSFCSHSFTSKDLAGNDPMSKNTSIGIDDFDIEVEYIK